MKKVISLAVSVIALNCVNAIAQTVKSDAEKASNITALEKNADTVKPWDIGGLISVSFSQASFTNWAAGGQNAIGLATQAPLFANYHKGKFIWLNDAQMSYGFQQLDNEKSQKTTDQLAVTSNAGYKAFDHMFISVLANLQTQFQPGYIYPNDSVVTSRFFSPAYLVLAAGVTYNPKKWLSVFLSPATMRITFVEDQALADKGAYGVTPAVYDDMHNKIKNGENTNTELGAYFKGNFSKEIIHNVTLTTSLELFSDYFKNPQNVVVNWITFIQLKVNKFISATLNTQLIYDNSVDIPIYKDINGVNTQVGAGPRLQFKEILGVGFAYKL